MTVKITYGSIDYAIHITDNSYDLVRYGTVIDEKSKNFGKPTETLLGYCTSMGSALNALIRNAFASQEETITLLEYKLRIERAVDELKSFVNVNI